MSLIFPKPTSGSSPQSAWLNQFIEAARKSRTISVEGFNAEETTDGINFKKKFAPPPQSSATQQSSFFPFKIYKIGNVLATTLEKSNFNTFGNITGTSLGNPPLDADINNFTFQIRSGLISARTAFVSFGAFESIDIPGMDVISACANTDGQFIFDSPPTPPSTGSSIIVQLKNATDTLIRDLPFTLGDVNCQIVLDSNPDENLEILAAFWLKIVDGPAGVFGVQLWGRMWTNDPADYTLRQEAPFPTLDPTVIEIGIVNAGSTTTQPAGIQQWQWGNLINRYAGMSPVGNPLGPITTQRGKWTADSLSGNNFYIGDVVIDDTVILFDGTAQASPFGLYVYGVYTLFVNGYTPATPPSGDLPHWRLTGSLCTTTPL